MVSQEAATVRLAQLGHVALRYLNSPSGACQERPAPTELLTPAVDLVRKALCPCLNSTTVDRTCPRSRSISHSTAA